MKKVAFALLLCLLLAGCHTPAEQEFSAEESTASSQSAAEFSTESVITEISLPEESSESSAEELMDLVRQEKLDMAIVDTTNRDRSLHFRKLCQRNFCAVLPEDHPLAGSGELLPQQLSREAQVVFHYDMENSFGQWASGNAQNYFDNERQPLKEKQIQEYADLDIPIADYWEYREGLNEQKTIEEKFDYIAGLDLPVSKKNIMINNAVQREEDVDLTNYSDFGSYEEFDFAASNPEKYNFLQNSGVSYEEYNRNEVSKEAYNWAYKNQEGYTVSRAVSDVVTYRQIAGSLYDIKADKDEEGKSISGSRKEKVLDYINGLDLDYGARLILFKSEYPSYDDANMDIIDYLNGREDISYNDMTVILTELGFTVDAEGNIYW